MPRSITSTFRRESEAEFSDEVDLCFLTITHGTLLDPIRVVWDNKDFIYGGHTFIGFPFEIELLTDDESPPTARLSIQNVDQIIGETIRSLNSPPQIKIELLSSSDFDITVNPRVANTSPEPNVVYMADKMFLINVTVDVFQVSGEIQGWNYLQRVWPGKRARQEYLPGLFR